MLKEKVSNGVIMHLLVCTSYLSKDRFSMIRDECKLTERITDFVAYYKNLPLEDNDTSTESERNNILALCDYIFTKKIDEDNEGSMSKDDQYEYRLKELRNDRSDIKFECFQDEIS